MSRTTNGRGRGINQPTTSIIRKKQKVGTEYYCGMDAIHQLGVDIPNRQLYIHGIPIGITTADEAGFEPGIEYTMANGIIKNLQLLLQQSATEPVVIHLHTCGGLWEEGMAIYDNIRSMPFPVAIVNHTHARSMSSIVLQAGDRRIMMPHSHILIHHGEMGVVAPHNVFYSTADYYRQTEKIMIGIYVEQVKQSKKFAGVSEKTIYKKLKRLMDIKGDVFFTAKEAVKWGFADAIFTSWDELF